jgi:hypothetical protein
MDIDPLTKIAANSLLQTTRQIGRQVGKSGIKLTDRSIEDCGVSVNFSVNMTFDVTRTRQEIISKAYFEMTECFVKDVISKVIDSEVTLKPT